MWRALLWRPTKASHSVLRAFRFRSPGVERAYQEQCAGLRVVTSAAYFAFSSLVSAVHCTSFAGPRAGRLPASFWCLLALALVHAAALSALGASRLVRRWVVVLHAVVVSFSMLALCCLSFAYADSWHSTSMLKLRGQFPSSLLAQVSALLEVVYGNQSRTSTALGSQYHLISLAFIGYNHSTVPLWLSFLMGFTVVTILSPYRVAVYVALFSVELCLATIPFPFLCICVEVLQRRHFHAQQELLRELEVSQMAEGMLNTTVKNVLADAAANIQEFLTAPAGCPATNTLLQETLTGLARGIRSCRQRQAFLALVSATYEPRLLPVSLRDFGAELVAGRAVAGDFVEGQVLLDPLLCSLVLENAIAQAFQHGHPECPDVHVRISEQSCFGGATPMGQSSVQAVFEVSFVGQEDGAGLRNGNDTFQLRAGAPAAHHMTQRHLKLAADAHQMTVQWLRQEERLVFRATCTVQAARPRRQQADPPPSRVLDAFPAGLTFYVIDDSTAARRVLASCITHLAAPAAVHCYGMYPEDVHQFVGAASQDADIVICDQHLDYGDQHYLGTDLIHSLRDRGFRGLLCVRSADMSENDQELYRAAGAHCMFGKEALTRELVDAIKAAYVELKALDQPDVLMSSPFRVCHDGHITFGQESPPPSALSAGWDDARRFSSHTDEERSPLSWAAPIPL